MHRPFTTRYSAKNAPGVLDVRIRFVALLAAHEAEIVEAARDKFADLANSGALCGLGIQPERSGLRSAAGTVAETTALWRFSDVRIDPLSLSVLVNIVHYLHENYVPVAELSVAWAAIARIEDFERVRLPPPFHPLSFAFSFDDSIPSFDIVLDFQAPQNLELVDEIEGIVGMWFSGANLGAYGDESSPPAINRIDFTPDVSTVDEEAIVWHIERFFCGNQAIDGLLNVVSRINRTHARIRSLEITE